MLFLQQGEVAAAPAEPTPIAESPKTTDFDKLFPFRSNAPEGGPNGFRHSQFNLSFSENWGNTACENCSPSTPRNTESQP